MTQPPYLLYPLAMLDRLRMSEASFISILEGCRQQHRASQYRLHSLLYNYAMTIARRYAGSTMVAEEVVNDAFFKIFSKIGQFEPRGDIQNSFKSWMRRVVVNTAIDRYRSDLHIPNMQEWAEWHDSDADDGITENLTFAQILEMLDQVPPAYRTVFNLFVAEGYSHEEIADLLGSSIGSSKSNLSRARQHIRRLLSKEVAFSV